MGPFLGKDKYLPAMGGETDSVTISGISGGSYAATQMHVIYSDLIQGAGLIIGGPFGDDNNSGGTGNTATDGISKATTYYANGLIDNPENLENQPVYIFSGADDDVVLPAKQEAQQDFYTNYSANLDYVSKDGIGHEIPSVVYDGTTYTYDLAGDLFEHLLTNLENNSVSSINAYDSDW
jgi:predicted esterase